MPDPAQVFVFSAQVHGTQRYLRLYDGSLTKRKTNMKFPDNADINRFGKKD